MFTCWSLITPISDGPDEAANIVQAAAVDHGQFEGTRLPYQWAGAKMYEVRIPWFYALTEYSMECQAQTAVSNCSLQTLVKAHCSFTVFIRLQANVANCTAKNVGDFSKPAVGFTYVEKYPPDYYLLVGIPSLFMPPGYDAVYLMREISILVSSGLLASLFLSIYQLKRRKWTFLGVLIAMTPTAIYLQSIVNGINLEGLAGLCFVFYASQLALDSIDFPKRLLYRMCFAGVILISVRPTGIVWFAVDLIPIIGLWAAHQNKKWIVDKKIRVSASILAAAGALNIIWQVAVGQNEVVNNFSVQGGIVRSFYYAIKNQYRLQNLTEIVGQFSNVGNYVKSPFPVTIIWLLCWVGIVVQAILKGKKEPKFALLVYLYGYIFIALLMDAYFVPTFGRAYWQEYFGFGAMTGIPVLAGIILDSSSTNENRAENLLTSFLPYLLWTLVFVNFMVVERWDTNGWSPIVPPAILISVELITLFLILSIMVPLNKSKFDKHKIDELKISS